MDFWSNQPHQALLTAASLDSEDFLLAGSIAALARLRQSVIAHNRLSPQRIREVTSDISQRRPSLPHVNWDRFDKDIALLYTFATDGIPLVTAHAPGPLASNYRAAPQAVDAHIFKAQLAGLGILLTTQVASLIPDRNEMRSSVALKMVNHRVASHWTTPPTRPSPHRA